MREIKFRAWDKIDHKMYFNIGFSMIGIQVYEDENVPEVILLDRGRDCFELMQYTGLKDKDGKEIYEGDIVRSTVKRCSSCDCGNFTLIRILQVECQSFGGKITFDSFVLYNKEENCRWGANVLDSLGELKVIGNIYENPDLLTPNQ